jgi:hypothetical protein
VLYAWFRNFDLVFYRGAVVDIYEVVTGTHANVELWQLHAPVWWGAVMLALGAFYCIRFKPSKG